ncbi:MAG: hypothetical protein KDA20_07215 [Phycisphaerales bacterium]|nr:hypothetical protein [Phycisphaerales bacterium]
MSELLTRLLDLESLRLGQEGVVFGLARPLPAWAWVLIVAGALAWSGSTYARLTGQLAARIGLVVLRALLLVLVVVLICGPRLVHRHEEVDQDWVVTLVDRSASLTIGDAPSDAVGGPRQSRDAQLSSALRTTKAMWDTLAAQRTLLWLGFDRGAFDLQRGDGVVDPVELGEASGRRTALGVALDQMLARAAARPVAGVVVMSDGRSADGVSRAAMRRLAADRIPVFVVPLGSEKPVSDVQVTSVDGPRVAYAADFAPVVVEMERVGAGQAAGEGATVRLIDTLTGQTLDEQRVVFSPAGDTEGASQATATLTTRPEIAGAQQWSVEVIPDGDDLLASNNVADVRVEIVDRPMRVLFIDGYPRWEQRYLRNLLLRERSVNASTLILATDRRYLQEGDTELERLPVSPEEWAAYDAIVLGDVSPEVFTVEQLEQLREHVATRGAGLLWSAGPGSTPRLWFDTPLADLLPFPSAACDGTPVVGSVVMTPSPEAERLGVLRLGEVDGEAWPTVLQDPSVGWSLLRYAQAIDGAQLKPTAQVLAYGTSIADGRTTPMVLSMRFGAGRSLYVATDEIWRWRYGRGELLFERFWLQLLRMLGRDRLARSGAAVVMTASPKRVVVEQPVRVSLELLDQYLVDLELASITVQAQRSREPGEAEAPAIELTLERVGAAVATARGAAPESASYVATWIPAEPGRWTIRPDEADLVGVEASAEVQVVLPDDELRHPEADHAALADLAARTGGQVVLPGDLGRLAELLPNRERRRVLEQSESLWDTPLAMLLLFGLLTVEWVGRRAIRLA